MSINLSKGQKINLSKEGKGLKELLVGLGWKVNSRGGEDFDLDAAAFLLLPTGKVDTEQDFVFYKNLEHKSGAVIHSGDNVVGGTGADDDEQISVYVDKIPDRVDKIVFTVTIYDADARRQNFGRVESAYIRIVDKVSGEEICRFDLGEDFSIETAMVVGEMYRHSGTWKFNAIGQGYAGGLAALCNTYGIDVE